MVFYQSHNGIFTLAIYVQPRASRTQLAGMHGESLKIKIAAPPVDGAANQELVRFFSEIFGIPSSQIVLKRGSQSRHKILEVKGVNAEELEILVEKLKNKGK